LRSISTMSVTSDATSGKGYELTNSMPFEG
jgi:hypothetical protein